MAVEKQTTRKLIGGDMGWKKPFFFGGAVLLLAACSDATAPNNALRRGGSAAAARAGSPSPSSTLGGKPKPTLLDPDCRGGYYVHDGRIDAVTGADSLLVCPSL